MNIETSQEIAESWNFFKDPHFSTDLEKRDKMVKSLNCLQKYKNLWPEDFSTISEATLKNLWRGVHSALTPPEAPSFSISNLFWRKSPPASFECSDEFHQALRNLQDHKAHYELVKSVAQSAQELMREKIEQVSLPKPSLNDEEIVFQALKKSQVGLKIDRVAHPQERIQEIANTRFEFAVAQALAVQKAYRDRYYVFVHGQQADWMFTSLLGQALLHLDQPEIRQRHFHKYMRHPRSTDPTINIEKIQQKSLYEGHFDHSEWARANLLSVDSDLFNRSHWESAIHFINNCNILDRQDRTGCLIAIRKLMDMYVTEPVIRRELTKKVETLISSYRLDAPYKQPRNWNYAVFCVPKEVNIQSACCP